MNSTKSINRYHEKNKNRPHLLSPPKAGCIQMLLFGNAVALVFCVSLPNHRALQAYTSRQLFVANIPRMWKYLFATCDHAEAKLLKFSPLHG